MNTNYAVGLTVAYACLLMFTVGGLAVYWGDKLDRFKNSHYCVPREAGLGEFHLSPDELADLYTAEQLRLLVEVARTKNIYGAAQLFDAAHALRCYRDAVAADVPPEGTRT